jgi:hypothetical protein
MSEYSFKYSQRYAVYKAFEGICQWCHEPVDFQSFHVDHVLPEDLLKNPSKLSALLQQYGLSSSFDINDYENWIPAHSHCNQRKSDKVYAGAPFIRDILDRCAKNKEVEQRIAFRLEKEPKKAEMLAKVQAAINTNLLNIKELQNFILRSDIMDSDDEELNQIRRRLEESVGYQREKMVVDMMDMLKMHTHDVAKSICSALGSNWNTYVSLMSTNKNMDSRYAFAYPIKNNVDDALKVVVVVSPDVIDNQLIIKFRNESQMIGEMTQDLKDGVEYNRFRTVLRGIYKDQISMKLK